jgi:ABC-type sugar transport system permease subunit
MSGRRSYLSGLAAVPVDHLDKPESRPSRDPEFLELSFTTANYFRAFAIREFWEASLNTFYFASVSTLFSFVLGTFLAWTVVRTNTPLAQLIGMITSGASSSRESSSPFPGSYWLAPA